MRAPLTPISGAGVSGTMKNSILAAKEPVQIRMKENIPRPVSDLKLRPCRLLTLGPEVAPVSYTHLLSLDI